MATDDAGALRPRPVVLHYHVFKNAGSTVDDVLERNFGLRFARLDSDDRNAVVGNDALVAFLDARPDVAAIASHHLRPPLPDHKRFAFRDILFVREPLARLASAYAFLRRTPAASDPLAARARALDARAFFALLLAEYPRHACNSQVSLIANGGRDAATEADLSRAAETVREAAVPGTTDGFDEACVLAEIALRPLFPGFDASYVAQNVRTERTRSLPEQLDSLRRACGADIFDRLAERNRLDTALHELAGAEVRRRLERVHDRESRFASLRARCAAREVAAAKATLASRHPPDFVRYANLGGR